MIKILEETGDRRSYLNIVMATSDKPIADIILNGKKLKEFL
jgi:hypothetical protein